MLGRMTLFGVGGLFLLVLVCALWPAPAGQQQADGNVAAPLASLDGLPYCGASMQLHDVYNLAGYEKSCDEIAQQGADSVMFVPSASMENADSDVIYVDQRKTLSEENLRALILHAKADKLRVVLMPIVLLDAPKNNEWRGTIHPDWDDWFQSYQDMILHYAHIAQDTGVNVLVVGSELVSSEPMVDDWKTTIHKVREVFKGQLTYSSNWDHYMMVQFWDQLDVVGMNSYWKLGPDDDSSVPVAEIDKRWAKIQADLFSWQAKTGHKPIMLLEAGWCSLANASYEPWDYTKQELSLDLSLQTRLYEGFFQSWWGKKQCAGFMLWEWTPESPGGPDDKGYTPRGKPAQEVMKQYFSKPRWAVE